MIEKTPPKLSAVICTHNRVAYLPKAIQSLLEQSLDPALYEILIIDNASTDGTAAVVESEFGHVANLRYVHEPNLGISYARNRGVIEARAPYLLYMDDDARALPDTLASILEAFETCQPTPDAMGGRIWLDWEGQKPDWVPDRYLNLFTHLDYGDESFFLEEDQYLMGANIAFRVSALKRLGGFDPNLGRVGGRLRSGEETALINLMLSLGWPVYYEAKAIVWHVVPPSRKKKKWLWSRFYWDGASQPLLMNDNPSGFFPKVRLVLFELKQVFKYMVYVLYHLFTNQNENEMLVVYRMCISQRLGRARTRFLILWRSLFRVKPVWTRPQIDQR
jgi:glycosyltransferase involved in cell wall biosynthesis